MSAIVPYSQVWLAERKKYIGASEVAALWGVQAPYQKSLYTLFMVKAGRLEDPEVTGERPKWGRRLEDVIAEACAEEFGWMVRRGDWVPDGHCRLASTIDYYRTENGRVCETVETKNTDWLEHRKKWTDEEPPLFVQLQAQAQLACTALPSGHVVALVGGNHLEPYAFERDERIIADMRARVDAFWQSIAENKPPPVDGSDSTRVALAQLWPVAVLGKPYHIDEDERFWEACNELRAVRDKRLEAEKVEKALKNELVAKMGDCEIAIHGGDQIIATCKTIFRKGYEVKPTSFRQFTLKGD